MALLLGFKINRFIRLNKPKFSNFCHIKTFSSQNSKLKYINQQIKSTSTCSLTPNHVERKLRINHVEQTSPLQITNENNFKIMEQNDPTSNNTDINGIPIIPSDLLNTSMTIRRKFAKSSTQNAITQPLKLPRLANPFPEPVKTLQSDTVSDEEKARQMQEQVKMEARYHLQMHQEMIFQQKLNKMSEKQNIQLNNNKVKQQPEQNQQMAYPSQQMNTQVQQMNTPMQEQPNYRKPKQYAELQHEEPPTENNNQQLNKSPQQYALNTTEKNEEDVKEKRPRPNRCRRKAHTRAARYLRHSWYPRGYIRRQMREYSTSPAINPKMMSESEQCDLIIKRLKSLYPEEYQHLKKPLLIPGSQEEKTFIQNILKLIGKIKSEPTKRTTAPFPSYSEVKTYKYEPRKQGNVTNKDLGNRVIFAPGSYPRFYSTKKNREKIDNVLMRNATKTQCPKFKLQGYRPANCISGKKSIPAKQEAPYPAYSEVCEDPYDQEPTVCKICSWKADVTSLLTSKSHNKHFSTSAGDLRKIEKQEAKKKPPCKIPFPPIPQCDYGKTAEKNAEKKRKKHCPKNKGKKCKASLANAESGKIISKIKSWLSTYKPGKENIKVSRSPTDIDGRETYLIDVCEYQEVITKQVDLDLAATNPQQIISEIDLPEIVEIYQAPGDGIRRKKPFENVVYQPLEHGDTHALEMTDPVPVQTRNIPDFITQSSTNSISPTQCADLKLTDVKEIEIKEVLPVKVNELKVNEVKENIKLKPIEPKINKIIRSTKNIPINPKQSKINIGTISKELHKNKINEDIQVKPKQPQKEIGFISKTPRINKITPNIEIKPKQRQIKIGFTPKEQQTNKVTDNLAIKLNRINIVKENLRFKTQSYRINEVRTTNKVQKEPIKPIEPKKKFDLKSKDIKLINANNNIYSKYQNFKVNDMKESNDANMPQQYPIVTRSLPGFSVTPGSSVPSGYSVSPGCKEDKGGCKKKKKEQCTRKKCRTRKKRPLPCCDDVKKNKTKTCLPLTIPGLEDKPEYMMNAPKKTYFKKSDNISNFIDIQAENIGVLANQKAPSKEEFVPFKLKPQFWKLN